MKKILALVLALVMVFALCACGQQAAPAPTAEAPAAEAPAAEAPVEEAPADPMEELIAAAKAEGELVVYGSCEEEYLAAACAHFEELYGIKTTYQRLSTGEVQAKIEEENGNPSGDVWFGGTTDPYNVAASEGLLEPYEAINASHLLGDMYRDKDGCWYGIYKGILGFTAPARARTSAPVSASSASASCMTASPRSSTTATATLALSSPPPAPPLRLAPPPSSRAAPTRLPPSSGSSTRFLPIASTSPRTTAPTSSW